MSMADLADEAAPVVEGTLTPTMPRLASSRDRVLPIFIVASLIVHATVMLPSLVRDITDKVAPPPKEIPVEIVQEVPKSSAPKPPPSKPQKVAQQEAPKPQPKPQPPKPQPPKPQPLKPQPPKAAAKQQPRAENVAERLEQLLGPMPAIALPSASAVGSDEVSYAQLVLSKVAKAKKEGRYQGTPGATSVAFSIGDAGEVVSVAIVRPSGDQSLDDEAIAMVKRGAPYPPPPPGGRRDYAITLRFQPLI